MSTYLENGSAFADGTYLDANCDVLDLGYLKRDEVVEDDIHQKGHNDDDSLIFPGTFTILKGERP